MHQDRSRVGSQKYSPQVNSPTVMFGPRETDIENPLGVKQILLARKPLPLERAVASVAPAASFKSHHTASPPSYTGNACTTIDKFPLLVALTV